jgi:hypothetical protein
MLFHGNQGSLFEVETIALQNWPEYFDSGFRPATFASKPDDRGCTQTADCNQCVKVSVESDHHTSLVPRARKNFFVLRFLQANFRNMPTLVAQLAEHRGSVDWHALVQKQLHDGQIGPHHAADVS